MTLQAAAAQARQYAHGSLLHMDAIGELLEAYRREHGLYPRSPNTPGGSYLDPLWAWVNDKLNRGPEGAD